MEKTPFFTQFNPNKVERAGEFNQLPSATEPDLSLSLEQLLKHHTRGGKIDTSSIQEGHYFGDEEIPDISRMDLVEVQELEQHYKDEQIRLKKRITELKKKQAENDKTNSAAQSELEVIRKKDVSSSESEN